MKEIVYLQKIYQYETILQIHVRVVPRIGIDDDSFVDNNHLDGEFKHKKHRHSQAENGSLHESRL